MAKDHGRVADTWGKGEGEAAEGEKISYLRFEISKGNGRQPRKSAKDTKGEWDIWEEWDEWGKGQKGRKGRK